MSDKKEAKQPQPKEAKPSQPKEAKPSEPEETSSTAAERTAAHAAAQDAVPGRDCAGADEGVQLQERDAGAAAEENLDQHRFGRGDPE